ncbi:MAG TPA: SDR family oxidoreductase [Labilithrix sp.]|nr:SDR family oxidoreductase [Labilithrix sp.]
MTTKTILITGATAGIGRHAALELVRQGHHVIATGRREDALVELREEAKKLGRGTLDVVRLDVTDDGEVQNARDAVNMLTAGRGVDVLVNNAGYGQMGPLETIGDVELRKQYETNVFGLMSVTRAFVPQMRDRGDGRIINVGSIGGRVTFPLMGAYSSTKHAVVSLSDALRVELAPFGISVSIVEPGPIRTGFNDRAMETIDVASVESSPYAPVLARAERFRRRFDARAAGPEVTTAAIAHAATARCPRARYVVPSSASIALALLGLVPTRIVDAIFRIAAGLTRKHLLVGAAS